MGNGKHQFFTDSKQVFGATAGLFKFTAVTVAAGYVATNDNKKKSGKHHRPCGNATDNLCRTVANRLLIFVLLPGTQQCFRLIIFQQAVNAGCQCMVQTLQIAFTSLYNSVYSFLLPGHSPQFLMQRVGRIIRFYHRIRCKFEGGFYLDSRIFLGGDKHFTQTTEKPLLPRTRHNRIPMCNDTMLHTLLGHYRILPGNYLFNVAGRYHTVTRLTQRTQHSYRVGIFLSYQGKHTIRPLYIVVIGKNKVLHFPPHE